MKAPGKGLLKTVSILFIIFGALFTIVSAFSLWSSVMISSGNFPGAGSAPGYDPGLLDGKTLLTTSVIMLVGNLLDLVFGIIGVRKCGDPSKSHFFFTAGVILIGLSVVSLYIGIITAGFQVTGLIPFVLPALYVIGSFINEKGAAVTE